jgi:hypothetical protein
MEATPSMKRLLILIVLSTAACSSSGSSPDEANADEYFYQCHDSSLPPGLTVYATDEAYRTFLDAISAGLEKPNDGKAAQLTAPMPDTTLSISMPPAFAFTPGEASNDRAPFGPAPARRSRWARFKAVLSLEGTAWAHCPNVSGAIFLLQIGTGAGASFTPAYTALASQPMFTPGAQTWQAKLGALSGQKVTVKLARAQFTEGRITGGPYTSTHDLSFTVVP